jgi:hypothetical protein
MPVRRTVSAISCLTSLLFFSSVSAGICIAGGPAPSAAGPPAATIAALNETARGLESPVFAVRESASQRLVDAQAPAVPVLSTVAKEGNLEAAVRAVGILEAIYVSADAKEDVAAIDGAEFALDELTRSGRPSIADRADIVLESHYDIRERRAVAEIERFHGRPVFGSPGDSPNAWNPNPRRIPAPLAVDRSGDSAKDRGELIWLIVGPKWTGGDEGLKQVARLKRLRMLYRIQGSPVSDEGIARLRAAIPGLEVTVRGAAKLGITNGGSLGEGRGCVIHETQDGEAAANAGLRPQDRIVRFAGHPVENFFALIDLLHNYKPGDTVDCLILRDEVPMTVPVTLTGWD